MRNVKKSLSLAIQAGEQARVTEIQNDKYLHTTHSETEDSASDMEIAMTKMNPSTQLDLKCPEPNVGAFPYQYLCGAYKYSTHLSFWTVDESDSGRKFWDLYGSAIAAKNLWISIGNLLLGFAVWLIWSVVTVLLLEAWESSNHEYYAFTSWKPNMTKHEYHEVLWLLPATAGLSGASLRLTNSFMIAPSGGRNVISQTAILLLIPMVMLVQALNDPNVSFEYLLVIALLTGAGGGACSSSLSNISFFYPKSKQGLALGLNAGIGNLGVSVMQFILPLIIAYPVFGSTTSIHIAGIGYIGNCAIFWIPFLVLFLFFAWFFMNSLPQHAAATNTFKALASFYYLEFLGFLGAGIAVVTLIFTHSYMTTHGMHTARAFVLWFIAVCITVLSMKYLLFCGFFASTNKNIQKTFVVLSMKHTWIMTNMYTMTFGSFIGFSASFALLTKDLFPNVNPLHFAWLGPFVGSVARPFGGWLSDKFGGARVTHYDVIIMILSTIGVGITLIFEKRSEHTVDSDLFPVFLGLFLVLFITTGIGNGSTFRMVPVIFTNKEHAGPILGWAAAISAYGAFVIPIILSECVELGIGEWAFFGFAAYYSLCLVSNWWYYYRSGAEMPC